ncbi:MAG: transposase, partial [Planctomycetaceae bacterium]
MTGGHRKDHEESFQEIIMSEKSKPPRRSFSDEFKQDAVDLVVKQNYSFKAAAEAVGVSSRSLREWHEKLAPERQPCDDDASAELLREENKQLKKRLLRAEMERDILKKSCARQSSGE